MIRFRVTHGDYRNKVDDLRDKLSAEGLVSLYSHNAEIHPTDMNGTAYRDGDDHRHVIMSMDADETLDNAITNVVVSFFPNAQVWLPYAPNYRGFIYGKAIAIDGEVMFDNPLPPPVCAWCDAEQLPEDHEDYEDLGIVTINEQTTNNYGYRRHRGTPTEVCEGCLMDSMTCDDCGLVQHSDDDWHCINGGDSIICGRCINNYSFCEECEEYFHDECEIHRVHEDWCGCDDCQEGRVIRNYSYRPLIHFYGTDAEGRPNVTRSIDKGELFMGFELETEIPSNARYDCDRDSIAEGVQSGLGEIAYLKEDGSLSNGFEIVTHPMSLDYAQRHFKWGTLERAAKDGLRAWTEPSCGLHIHLSRSAFRSEAHIYKFMLMVYRNGDALQQFAGRYNNSYARFNANERAEAKKRAKGEANYERYVAVNCQNAATLELRFYRPSLRPATVIAALEMTHALWAYTMQLSARAVHYDEGFTFETFRVWVASQPAYKHLSKRIDERIEGNEDL